jgi:hypothetical protein
MSRAAEWAFIIVGSGVVACLGCLMLAWAGADYPWQGLPPIWAVLAGVMIMEGGVPRGR